MLVQGDVVGGSGECAEGVQEVEREPVEAKGSSVDALRIDRRGAVCDGPAPVELLLSVGATEAPADHGLKLADVALHGSALAIEVEHVPVAELLLREARVR